MPDLIKILLIEDNPDHEELFTLYLGMTYFASAQVKCVPSLQSGKELLASDFFDITFLDLSLTDSSYSETIEQLDSLNHSCPIVVLTSLDDRNSMMNVINKGADDCLSKSSLNDSTLERTIQYNLNRWQLRKELSDERQRLQEIIRGTNVGTWEWNIPTGALKINQRWAQIIGYTLEELSPVTIDTWTKFIHPDDLEQSEKLLKKHFSGELDYYECEARIRHKHGQWIWVFDRGKVVEWAKEGQPIRASGTRANVTRKKRAAEALRRANEELENKVRERTADLQGALEKAEEANRAKGIFVANMSHEFRTPLNAVLGFSQLMLGDKNISDKQRKYLNFINQNGQHQLSLINDVLTMSNLEDGLTTLNLKTINFIELLESIIYKAKVAAKAKDITFEVKYRSELPQHIFCDHEKLKLLLSNVIDNAIKYTKSGGVILSVESGQTDRDDSTKLAFDVEDSGIGIPRKFQEHIFAPFFQLDKLSNKAGAGLGLTLAQRFLTLMGGKISVNSELGKGTIFHIALTVKLATAASFEPNKQQSSNIVDIEPDGNKYRILIVNGREDERILLQNSLESVGYSVRVACSGQQMIDLYKEWHPQMILIDMSMDNSMNTVKVIRALNGGAEAIIVAVSAFSFDEMGSDKLPPELDDIMTVPINQGELFELMAKHLGLSYRYEEKPEELPDLQEKDMKLVAKDLDILDNEIKAALINATNALDIEQTLKIAESIKKTEPTLGNALIALVDNLDFKTLKQLISSGDQEV